MTVKLIAKKDFEAINFWQDVIPVKIGDILDADIMTTDKGLKMIVINIGGVNTPYEVRVVKEYFEIMEGEL